MSGVRAPYRDRLEVLAAGDVVEAQLAAWAAQQSIDGARALASCLRKAPAAAVALGRAGVRGRGRPDGPGPAARGQRRGRWVTRIPARRRAGSGRGRVLRGGPEAPGAAGRARCPRRPQGRALPPGQPLHRPRRHRGIPRGTSRSSSTPWTISRMLARGGKRRGPERCPSRSPSRMAGTRASRSSWYGVVPGVPVSQSLSGPEATTLARRIGEALGELASSSLRPSRRDDATVQLARAQRGLARAAVAAPGLSGRAA